jgi:hypothetical protein
LDETGKVIVLATRTGVESEMDVIKVSSDKLIIRLGMSSFILNPDFAVVENLPGCLTPRFCSCIRNEEFKGKIWV